MRWDVRYQGPVRMGRFGQVSAAPQTVFQCGECGVGFLEAPEIDYASPEYRLLVDGDAAPERYYALHDGEQLEKLNVVGVAGLRGKVVADIGCGAGSFLDLVKGYAAATIGVEPMRVQREVLAAKGHLAAASCAEIPPAWQGRVDLAACFAVIEHVRDPVDLLRQTKALLAPGGRLIISTPNAACWLLHVLPQEFGAFFYRAVHVWYFDARSVEYLARAAGYTEVSTAYVHRYDLSNLLLWLRDRRPTGLAGLRSWPLLDAVYRRTLEAEGLADFLYASLRP